MSVVASVKAQLGKDRSWQAQTALALAAQVDESGSAAAARELRAVMAAIDQAGSAKAGDELDDFRARRSARGAR